MAALSLQRESLKWPEALDGSSSPAGDQFRSQLLYSAHVELGSMFFTQLLSGG